MADDGSPVAKQTRYSLRSSTSKQEKPIELAPERPQKRRYMLRSSVSEGDIYAELPPSKRIKSMKHNLMVLNDDCFLKIFEYLSPRDLCNVVQVNQRVNSLGKCYIQWKYKIQFAKDFDLTRPNAASLSLEVAKAFLCIFGKEAVTLKLTRHSFDSSFDDYSSPDVLLSSIQQNCSLKQLTLVGFGMCGINKKFCKQLKKLTLDGCSVTREWSEMKTLKILELNEVIFRRWPLQYLRGPPVSFPVDRFGQLTELRLSDLNLPNEAVIKLINMNPMLKLVSVVNCIGIGLGLIQAAGVLKELEEFEFKKQTKGGKVYLYELKPLIWLKKLKILKFHYNDYPSPQLLDDFAVNGIGIEHLELGGGHFNDETAISMGKLKTIKILHLNEITGLTESHILSIVKELKQLEELIIKMKTPISQNGMKEIVRAANQLTCFIIDAPDFTLDLETYEGVLTAVRERKKHEILELMIYGNGEQLLVPNDVLQGSNEKWLQVEAVDRKSNFLFVNLTSKVGLYTPPSRRYRYYSDESDSDDEYYY